MDSDFFYAKKTTTIVKDINTKNYIFKEEIVMRIIERDFRTKEQKRAERRARRQEIVNEIRNNMDVIVVMTPVVVCVVGGTAKVISKAIDAHKTDREISFKERTIYDRSLGRYTELKRPLTSTEALIIEERRMNGEKLNSILKDMNLIKR